MSNMAEPVDINVDELRRRARRRLVGAVVLALAVAVVVPMLLETEQKPLGEDVAVKIPAIDDGKFVNRLNDPNAAPAKAVEGASPPPPADSKATTNAPAEAPVRTSKYDTRIPQTDASAASTSAVATPATSPTETSAPDSTKAPSSPNAPDAAKDASAAKARERTEASSVGTAPQAPVVAAEKSVPPASTPVIVTDLSPPAASKPATVTDKSPSAPSKPVTMTDKSTSAGNAHRDGFAVQLAAFADDKGATSLAGRLKRAGYTAYTEPLKTSKGTLWRVRVGPYPSREAAIAARDKLKTEGQNGIVAAIR